MSASVSESVSESVAESVSAAETDGGTIVLRGLHDVDAADVADHTAVSLYAADIFRHALKTESESMPRPAQYLDGRKDVNAKMRCVLVDWISEVCRKFGYV